VKFHCARCKRPLKAKREMMGRVVMCPTCGKRMLLREKKEWLGRMLYRSEN